MLQMSGGAVGAATIASAPAVGAEAAPAPASRPAHASTTPSTGFLIDTMQLASPFPHYWEGSVGGDHAKQGLRRDYQDQLVRSHADLGVRSLRTHGVLAPQMSVYEPTRPASSGGKYSFFNVDRFYDFLVSSGMHPYVELSAMPLALAQPGGTEIFYYGFLNSPPKSFTEWGALIGTFARHLVDRYGIAEVRRWPFEVWNEPNLSFWGGTPGQYNQLYAHAARAIKSVDSSLQVGGPATDGDGLAFLEKFLKYVEVNDVPIDFVSSHGYENNSLSGVDGVANIFAPTRAAIPSRLRYIVSETGCNYDNVSDELDTSYAAASWVKTVSLCDGIVDVMSLWCFSDVFEEQTQAANIFYGGFGALTIYDVPKPLYRAGQLLHGLGHNRFQVSSTGTPKTVGVLATVGRRSGVDVLVYNHTYPGGPKATTERVRITVRGSHPATSGTLTRIDRDHANPRQRWFEMGKPKYPTVRQLDELNEASETHPASIRSKSHHRARIGTDVLYEVVVPGEGVAALHFD